MINREIPDPSPNTPRRPRGRPRKDQRNTLDFALSEINEELESPNPNTTRVRLIERKVEILQANQRRQDAIRETNLKGQVAELLTQVDGLTKANLDIKTKADGYDHMKTERDLALGKKDEAISALNKTTEDFNKITKRVQRLRAFAEFCIPHLVATDGISVTEEKRKFALKFFLGSDKSQSEVYDLLCVPEQDIDLWRQYASAWGPVKDSNKLLEYYMALGDADISKKWFLGQLLFIKFKVDVDLELKKREKTVIDQFYEDQKKANQIEAEKNQKKWNESWHR